MSTFETQEAARQQLSTLTHAYGVAGIVTRTER